MGMKTKTAILVEPGKFEIQEQEILLQPDEVLVKVEVCGLCNWELNHFKGLIGECPMTLGHEWAGIIEETGAQVTRLRKGDRVTVLPDKLEGFAQYAAVQEALCFRLRDDIDVKKGFLEPLKCIVTVLQAAAPQAGDYGVVVGCGPMGLWCLQALSGNLLAGLIAVDVDDGKLELAKRMGASAVVNSRREDASKRIRELTEGHMADFVIEGTGLSQVMEACADYCKDGPSRLCVMSYYEEPMEQFHFRRFLDKGTSIFTPHPVSEREPLDAARRATAMINNHTFRQEEIVTHTYRLEQIEEAFKTLANKPKDFVKGVVYPNA